VNQKVDGKDVPHYALTISVPVQHRQTFGNLCTQLRVPKLPTTNFKGKALMGSPVIRALNPLPEGTGPRAERTLTVNASMTVYDTALQGKTNCLDLARRCEEVATSSHALSRELPCYQVSSGLPLSANVGILQDW